MNQCLRLCCFLCLCVYVSLCGVSVSVCLCILCGVCAYVCLCVSVSLRVCVCLCVSVSVCVWPVCLRLSLLSVLASLCGSVFVCLFVCFCAVSLSVCFVLSFRLSNLLLILLSSLMCLYVRVGAHVFQCVCVSLACSQTFPYACLYNCAFSSSSLRTCFLHAFL